MPKQMVLTIGYVTYACSSTDAVLLLDVAARLTRVERKYPDIHRRTEKDDPLVTLAEMVEVGDPVPDERPNAAEPAASVPDEIAF